MTASVDINYFAVLVAAIVNMALGMFWYSPLLFGKIWIKLSGVNEKKIEEKKKKGMTGTLIVAFILALLTSFVLSHFVDYLEAQTFGAGMQTGFWLWLGFIAPLQMGMVLWEQKPLKLFFLNTSHELVFLLLAGGILAVWV